MRALADGAMLLRERLQGADGRTMIKLYGLLERRSDLTLAQFSHHWRTVHRDLALRLVAPGIMRGYVQNHRRSDLVPGAGAPADGCPELWIDSVETLAQLASAPEYLQGAYPDEANFMNGPSTAVLAVSETNQGISRIEAATLTRAMFFFRTPASPWPAMSVEWQDAAPWLMPHAHPLRLERDRCVPVTPGDPVEPYSAVESTWWRDLASFARAWAQRRPGTVFADAVAFDAMLVEEVVALLPATGI